MVTLSLCIIVKNEEPVIGRCLESVKGIFDEIIVVDTGSSDKTKEIVSKYTDRIYDFEWIDDFAAARNYSFSFATMDYIMWLDADEYLLPEDRNKLLKLKKSLHIKNSPDAINMRVSMLLSWKSSIEISYRTNIVKRERKHKWMYPVHEVLSIDKSKDTLLNIEIFIQHKPINYPTHSVRNINIFDKLYKSGITFDRIQYYYYARELTLFKGREKDAVEAFERYFDFQVYENGNKKYSQRDFMAITYLLCYYINVKFDEFKTLKYILTALAMPLNKDICYLISSYYMKVADYYQAIFWLNKSKEVSAPEGNTSYLNINNSPIYVWETLLICYRSIGDIENVEQCRKVLKSRFKIDVA